MRRDLIKSVGWHLDVGLSHPGAEGGSKGSAVLRLIVVHELGLERCETVRSLSAKMKTKFKYVKPVREDRIAASYGDSSYFVI